MRSTNRTVANAISAAIRNDGNFGIETDLKRYAEMSRELNDLGQALFDAEQRLKNEVKVAQGKWDSLYNRREPLKRKLASPKMWADVLPLLAKYGLDASDFDK